MGRREDNKRQKREALLAAGLAVFGAEGYDRASIEQIVKEAGVARGTFYLYFEDKLALFRALSSAWVDELLEIVAEVRSALGTAGSPAEALEIYQQMGFAIALFGLNHQQPVIVAFRETRRAGEAGDFLRAEEQRILDAVTVITAEAAERGLIQVRDPRLTVRMIFGAVERLYFDVLTGVELGDPTEVANEVVRTFTLAMGLSEA
ncbi:MAG: TetR/AcrR family transcriptional regulator [Myxococcota bacterium]